MVLPGAPGDGVIVLLGPVVHFALRRAFKPLMSKAFTNFALDA